MRKTDRNDLSALADRLKHYNEWRRGAETEQPHSEQIGKDIDAAIAIIEMIIDDANENGAS